MKILNRLDLSLLRGIRELSISETKVGKFVWFVLLLGAMGGCGFMMYTKVTLYMRGESQVVESGDTGRIEFPKISVCFQITALFNKAAKSKLYSPLVLYKQGGTQRATELRMSLGEALELEKKVISKMGSEFSSLYLSNIYATFGNLVSNPTKPLDFMDYMQHLMRPFNDFFLDCKFRGQTCNYKETQNGVSNCIDISLPSTVDTIESHDTLSVWLRLNQDLIEDFNSSLANYHKGITVHVHEKDTLLPMGNPYLSKSAVLINRPGIYDMKFSSRQGVVEPCNSNADNSYDYIANISNIAENATVPLIKDESACLQMKFIDYIDSNCRCIAPGVPMKVAQANKMMQMVMAGIGSGVCQSPGLLVYQRYSLDAFKMVNKALAAFGNWTKLKDEYFNKLIGVIEKTQMTNDTIADTIITNAADSFKCFANAFNPTTGKPRVSFDCSSYRRCKSLNYTIATEHMPIPPLSDAVVADLNARLITHRRSQAVAQTGSVAVLGKSWASIPSSPTAAYYQKNLIILKIRPADFPARILVSKILKYPIDTLLLDLGFFLVFFLGFSVLSIFEFFDVLLSLMLKGEVQRSRNGSRRTHGSGKHVVDKMKMKISSEDVSKTTVVDSEAGKSS